jgi:hypothetical protein
MFGQSKAARAREKMEGVILATDRLIGALGPYFEDDEHNPPAEVQRVLWELQTALSAVTTAEDLDKAVHTGLWKVGDAIGKACAANALAGRKS